MITNLNEWRKLADKNIGQINEELPPVADDETSEEIAEIEIPEETHETNVNEIDSVADYFSMLFELRQLSHDIHLTKTKLAPHLALGDFYDELLDLIDTIFETYQGQYGVLINFEAKINYDSSIDIIKLMETYTVSVKNNGKKLFTDTHLLNIVDEITALCYHTLYKLKYLGYSEDK